MPLKVKNQTIEHLFRNEYGKLVAILTHKFGIHFLELIEDALQDTFLKAMKLWGYKAVPENPTAWLFRVANNTIIDGLRRAKKVDHFKDEAHKLKEEDQNTSEIFLEGVVTDSQLKMIFACCHPSLSQEYQIILSLKLIGGFSNREISAALLKKEETVAKSFTRAKQKFKKEIDPDINPLQMGLQSRLFVVLRVIYLLFSEGYSATTGSQVIKRDFCYEALRLALLLRENTYCKHPNLEALIALMCFHIARFDARLDDGQQLVDLEHQDRSKYDQELIRIGIFHLESSETEDHRPSHYHLEAARSYYHSKAATFKETDWESILRLYDIQLRSQYSPIVALNRLVAYHKVHGAKKALNELIVFEKSPDFIKNSLFFAIKAELFTEMNDFKKAKEAFKTAITLSKNQLERAHLNKKLKKCMN